MIPLKLTLEGLYSYRQRQVIDFEQLTAAGLFGIFGQVGSGKSSILEAIMFALYNDTERLNRSGDDRYYNMLNLQSKKFYIDFQFRAGGGNGETYRFTCTAKRNKNPQKFEDVNIGKDDRTYYKLDGEQWIPLEGVQDATKLLGMDYKHFRQTCIIPQGKFREFIDQTSGDRTKMLKELFSLHAYDLAPQTGRLAKECELKLENLSGQLQPLLAINKESLANTNEVLVELGKSCGEAEKNVQEKTKRENSLAMLEKAHQDARQSQVEFEKLKEQEEIFRKRKGGLDIYRKAREGFADLLLQEKELERETEQCQQLVAQNLKAQELAEKTHAAAVESYTKAEKAYAGRDELKDLCQELERLLQAKALGEKLAGLKQAYIQHKEKHEKLNSELTTCNAGQASAEETLKQGEAQQKQYLRLSEAYQWFVRNQEISLMCHQESHKLQRLNQDMLELRSERETALADFSQLAQAQDWGSLFESLESKLAKFKNDELELDKKHQQVLVQQKLSQYAQGLTAGEACPLCGSLNHPHASEHSAAAEELERVARDLHDNRQKQHQFLELKNTLSALKENFKHISSTVKQHKDQLQNWDSQKQEHDKEFNWPELAGKDTPEVKQLREEARAAQQKFEQLQEASRRLRQQEQQLQQKINQQQAQFASSQQAYHKLEGQYEKYLEELSDKTKGWLQYETAKISRSLHDGQQKISQIELQWQQAQARQQQTALQKSQAETRQEEAYKNLERYQAKQEGLEKTLQQRCRDYGFMGKELVETILAKKLHLEQEEQEIEGYFTSLAQKESIYNNLNRQLKGQPYDAETHAKLKQELAEAKQTLEGLKEERTRLSEQLKQQESQLKQKQELEKEQEKLQIRLDNLKEMARLFKGQGFVDFASSHYLQSLCRSANERFFRLTHNNLSLELDEKHNFIVRDYLNGGRTRLLKTLSGGQSFQAALCLALAMTEYIKSLTGADQSFFFLDEGFGSLDKESLRVVFDTLKSLRHENRIVGVISHVEELQQEIDLYLKIENDTEMGSLVNCSWQMAD